LRFGRRVAGKRIARHRGHRPIGLTAFRHSAAAGLRIGRGHRGPIADGSSRSYPYQPAALAPRLTESRRRPRHGNDNACGCALHELSAALRSCFITIGDWLILLCTRSKMCLSPSLQTVLKQALKIKRATSRFVTARTLDFLGLLAPSQVSSIFPLKKSSRFW